MNSLACKSKGKPVIFMHGFPGSRLDWLVFDQDNIAAELNARVIAVDRPGMGLSDHQHIQAEVYLWHGENDDNVPGLVGRFMADAIPNCQATFLKAEGHFSTKAGLIGSMV